MRQRVEILCHLYVYVSVTNSQYVQSAISALSSPLNFVPQINTMLQFPDAGNLPLFESDIIKINSNPQQPAVSNPKAQYIQNSLDLLNKLVKNTTVQGGGNKVASENTTDFQTLMNMLQAPNTLDIQGRTVISDVEYEGAVIPTPLTPNNLAKQLKFSNVLAQPSPNSNTLASTINQGQRIYPNPPIALPNYLSLLQRQKNQLPSLPAQPGGSNIQNSALQLLQLQKLLAPAPNIPLLGTLPYDQCACSQPIQSKLDGNLKLPSTLQQNNPLQTQPLESQSNLQLLSPLDILNALQSKSPSQLLSLLKVLSPSQLQSLLQSWSPLQLLLLLKPPYSWHLSPPLQNSIRLLLQQKLNLQNPNLNQPPQVKSPLNSKVNRQLPNYPLPTTISQNNNIPTQTTPCQQLRELFSKILPLITSSQSSTIKQNDLSLTYQNPNQNMLNLGRTNPLQFSQQQPQLIVGNNNLPLNLKSNLQFQTGQSSPTLVPIYQQNLQNVNKMGSLSPMNYNIINPTLAAIMGLNKRLMKRSTKTKKSSKGHGLVKYFPNAVKTARISKNINTNNCPEKPGQINLNRNVAQPLNVARNPKSINAINIPGPFGIVPGLQQPSLLHPLSVNTREVNNPLGPLPTLLQGLQIQSQARPSPLDTKSFNYINNQGIPIPNEAKTLPMNSSVKAEQNILKLQDGKSEDFFVNDTKEMPGEYKTINPKESNFSSVKTENLTISDDKAENILGEDIEVMAKEDKHVNSKESNSTDAEKSHKTSKENETIIDETDERESSIDTKIETGKSSPLKESFLLKERDNPNGGLKLASQLLKEARLDLSALDNIINSYSIKENELLDISPKVNEDNPLISQGIVETDTSDGLDGSRTLNKLKGILSSTEESIEKSDKKQDTKINPSQLDSLLKSRLESDKNPESLETDASSNETNTDTKLSMVSHLVNEAKIDISKIQEDLAQSLSLHNLEKNYKRETEPFQTNIIKASTLLNQAQSDLGSMQTSLLAAQTLNDIKANYTDSQVKGISISSVASNMKNQL